jgi:uncharacterized RDD family membrane protein YckC
LVTRAEKIYMLYYPPILHRANCFKNVYKTVLGWQKLLKTEYEMENRTKMTKIKRFSAFIFDTAFIALLVFNLYMLIGLISKIDSDGYQNVLTFPLLLIIITYLFFGELIFKNTIGKYLFGIVIVDNTRLEIPSLQGFIKRGLLKLLFPIEGLVLLLSKSRKRLGDIWAKTIVVNKETNKFKSSARLIIGMIVLIFLVFIFRISMGLAVKKTDFYNAGIKYLKSKNVVEIAGLPKVANQTRCTVNFIVPISNENQDRYAIIYLEKNGNEWIVNQTKFIKEHITGFSYGFSYASCNH